MPDEKKSLLSNKTYNFLKWFTTVVLPAASALYFALAQLWSLPKAEEVMGSISASAVFLGVLLGVSTKSYNNSDTKYMGAIEIDDSADDRTKYSLNFNGDPRAIDTLKEVIFRVDGGNK